MKKKELRKKILHMRDHMDHDARYQNDEKILLQLLNMKEYRDAQTLMIFVSYKSEVDTHCLITESLRRGKRILIPIVNNYDNTLLLSQIQNMGELEKGSYGILEPKPEYVRIREPKCVDFCLVPGAVFDKNGYRIGYGGGYYDKLLPLFRPDTLKIGVAYDFQKVDTVPTEPHDQKLDALITEKEVYWFSCKS
ncbi:MAG: 5-formyltetrahydrofolate cyclo-ligase [Tissierellia bacterium]|nr:5-formyltetrahydrofolate cyclo-ligase [Tissierellia bacterium]